MTRSSLSAEEIEYLSTQSLARIASVDARGAPRVVPTGFHYDRDSGTIACGGIDLAATRRYRDVQTNPRVAIVIDDLASEHPWWPRAVMIRGTAQVFDEGGDALGPGFSSAWMRITPTSITSLGLSEEA